MKLKNKLKRTKGKKKKEKFLPPGKNQSACVTMASMIALTVPVVIILGLGWEIWKSILHWKMEHLSFIHLSLQSNAFIQIFLLYSILLLLVSTEAVKLKHFFWYSVMEMNYVSHYSFCFDMKYLLQWTKPSTYVLFFSDHRRLGPITIAILLGFILFTSLFSANLAKNLIRYLENIKDYV